MKQGPEVLLAVTTRPFSKQANSPSVSAQPPSLISTNTLSYQEVLIGFSYLFILYFHVVPRRGLASNSYLITFIV